MSIARLFIGKGGMRMDYSFDKVVSRYGTKSLKYDFAKERGLPEGVIPMWVADMDFRAPDELIKELHKTVEYGIYGYSGYKDSFIEIVQNWYETHFGWRPEKEWYIPTPGVVFAISAAIRALTKEKDAIIIQTPVYYPFSNIIVQNNRTLVTNSLQNINGHYEIDFEDFEQKIIEKNVKLFVLCSPHNPVGRVWKREELERLAEICIRHSVYVVSDEIHSDFTYEGHQHTVFAQVNKKISDQVVICTSPSKTFNIAGLQISNIFIPNKEIREKFSLAVKQTGYEEINIMALTACETLYQYGQEWLTQLKAYLKENIDYVREFLKRELPKVKLIEPEGTYLLWLDFRDYSLSDEELRERIIQKANLWLDEGTMFGIEGEGYERMNIACPKSIIEQAMKQLKVAFDGIE